MKQSKITYFLQKILLLALFSLIVFPMSAFAQHGQGQVVGYYQSWLHHDANRRLRNLDLERLTHLVLFQVYPQTNGSLDLRWWGPFQNQNGDAEWSNFVQNTLVSNAHARNVSVLLGVGGGDGATWAFAPTLANSATRTTFINNIVSFLNKYNLDGVCLDWEFPRSDAEWISYMDLLVELRAHPGMQNRRIQIAIGADSPVMLNNQIGDQYAHFSMTPNGAAMQRVRRDIWQADAIGLMTYDMFFNNQQQMQNGAGFWARHADPRGGEETLKAWAAWGAGQPGFHTEKLLIGIATYGTQTSRGDNQADIQQKINFTRNNGFGGAIVWQIQPGYTQPAENWSGNTAHNNDQLWQAIWAANESNGGWTGGGQQPVQNFTVTFNSSGGSAITGSPFTVEDGQTVARPTDPTRNGFTFDGWFLNDAIFNFNTPITQNTTLTARWTATGGGGGNGPTTEYIEFIGSSVEWSSYVEYTNPTVPSTVHFNVSETSVNATLSLGTPNTETEQWVWLGFGVWDAADFSTLSKVSISYTASSQLMFAIGETGKYVELPAGTHTNREFTLSDFGLSAANLNAETGIIFFHEQDGESITLQITSLRFFGPRWNDQPIFVSPRRITRDATTGINATVSGGNIRLSLPQGARTASVAVFDLRGRLLFEQNVSAQTSVANVALPNFIARNQPAILQVRTNSGLNLTRRILVK